MPKTRAKATTRRSPQPEPQAFYITTDLLVSSRVSLAPLAAALPDAQHPFAGSGRPMARLLVPNGISRSSVETDFRRFIVRLSALRGAALRSWRTAKRQPPFATVADLGKDIRPVLDRLTPAMLRALAEALPVLAQPGGRELLEGRRTAILGRSLAGESAVREAVAPLLKLSR